MAERLIQPVKDTKEKYYTYKKYISRHNMAVKEGFYFEALLIDYALMEDRLRSFLYHMGMLKTRDSFTIDVAYKKTIKSLVETYTVKGDSKGLGISSISGKMKIVRCITEWSSSVEMIHQSDRYEMLLKQHMEGVDADGLLSLLNNIGLWCKYRNEIIHSLLNKNLDSVDAEIAEKEKLGFDLACSLDNFVKAFERGNTIRRKIGLTVEKLK